MLYFISLIACIGYTYITAKSKSPFDYAILVGLCLINILGLSVMVTEKVILELTKLH